MGGKGKWKKGFPPRRGFDADSAIKWGGGQRWDCEEEVSEDWTQKRDWGWISGRKSSDWEKCLPREEEDML